MEWVFEYGGECAVGVDIGGRHWRFRYESWLGCSGGG